jgi:hypothetical protein
MALRKCSVAPLYIDYLFKYDLEFVIFTTYFGDLIIPF